MYMFPRPQEVKIRGMGQSFPGVNPSGGPAFMYQAQTPPPAAPPVATPDAGAAAAAAPATPPPAPPAPAMPQTTAAQGTAPALPPSPAPTAGKKPVYVLGGIAIVAFGIALLWPSH